MTVRVTTIILTPPATRALTTPEVFKIDTNKTAADRDEYIGRIIKACSRAIEQYCNRSFGAQTIKDLIRIGRGSNRAGVQTGVEQLVLSVRPVAAIVSVADASGTLDPSLYELDQEAATLLRLSASGEPIEWGAGLVTVQYRAGYVLPSQKAADFPDHQTLPEDIEQAAIEWIKLFWFASTGNRDPSVKMIVNPEAGTTSFWLGMPPSIEVLLTSYRDIAI